MGFADLGGFFTDDALELPPIPSKAHPQGFRYRIPSPTHKTGLRLTAMVNLGISFAAGTELSDEDSQRISLDDEEEREFLPMVLGPVLEQMYADDVSWVFIQRAGQYALLYFTLGEDAANEAARRGAQGEAPAPNRAEKRAAGKKAKRSPQASSGSATSTRPRGSTAGTTSLPT